MTEEKGAKREWHASDGDLYKSIYDHLKHVATLATGSILLLSTFLEKVFKDPLQTWLVGLSLGSLFLALVSSIISYAAFLMAFPRPAFVAEEPIKNISAAGLVVTWMAFLVGIGAIGTFFLINWYSKH